MEPASSDYMSLSDLSRPRETPLQTQLEKIDPSIIRSGTPTPRSHRRGHARQRADSESALFEISVLAFREIILSRLWKQDMRFQSESDFCKHQWNILKPRKALLIECAEVLTELSAAPTRPCSEHVCKALADASIRLQPSALQRRSIVPELWQRVLRTWQKQYGIRQGERVDVENMTAAYVEGALFPQAAVALISQVPAVSPHYTQLQLQHQQQLQQQQHQQQHSPQVALHQGMAPDLHYQQHASLHTNTPTQPFHSHQQQPFQPLQPLIQQHQHQHQHQPHTQPQHQHPALIQHWQQTNIPTAPTPPQIPVVNIRSPTVSTSSAANSHSQDTATAESRPSSAASTHSTEPFRERVAHLLTDPRRFHAPAAVLERVHQFFKGPPLLDPATFDESTMNAPISIPFPDIMDSDGWRIPVAVANPGVNGAAAAAATAEPTLGPIESCFLHVPVLPSKRRYETDTEVILLDDCRLAGQLNAKLWEEFSNGNVQEAITLVPTSATWFGKTELADWPCVVMSGLKFEQANGSEPSGKKYSEIHSYIVVYLGRDPMRQAQFVQIFQDLGISPSQNPESVLAGTLAGTSTQPAHKSGQQQHRWIAGFRRLFRSQGVSPAGSSGGSGPAGAIGSGLGDGIGNTRGYWRSQDAGSNGGGSSFSQGSKGRGNGEVAEEEDSIDPQFDDIYSILPPNKKPRLERMGRPSDAKAAWHHSKRRKMDENGFRKLQDQDVDDRQWGSDADMSE